MSSILLLIKKLSDEKYPLKSPLVLPEKTRLKYSPISVKNFTVELMTSSVSMYVISGKSFCEPNAAPNVINAASIPHRLFLP